MCTYNKYLLRLLHYSIFKVIEMNQHYHNITVRFGFCVILNRNRTEVQFSL